jgi:hypothetical protein
MEKVLRFKCTHCDRVFSYPEDGVDVKGIHAVEGKWLHESQEENHLVEQPPEINSIQTVTIGGKFRIDLNKEFWLYYVDPWSFYNGIEKREGISAIRFCRCALIVIQSSGETNATLTVQVKEVLSVEDIDLKNEFECELPEWWKNLLKDADKGQVIDFDDYCLLFINIQSDLGLTLVIKKGIVESRILMAHDWDFHTNAFYGTNIKIKNSVWEKFRVA